MPIPAAYLAIIMLWSTTPLTIQWSTQGIGFAFAALSRMVIGLAFAALLMLLWRVSFPLHPRARRSYLVGGVGLFGSMAFTYWGARYVHSGLVSVMFGLSPLVASIMAGIWLGEKSLTPSKISGAMLGAAGLTVIFLNGDALGGERALAGMAALVIAVILNSACLVGLKRIGDDSPPTATTVGVLLVSLPMFVAFWLITDGRLPDTIPTRTAASIAYLGVFGSAVGFSLYYYVIKHLKATKVALITLITPVVALLLGNMLNDEIIGPSVWLGTGLILLGLALHQRESLIPLLRQMRAFGR